ncbi:MAG: hypothetical protein E4H41_00890 [Gemmatimonadales bacterium]|nr:MAG: hypothetical protein E4H41_00890 [Gemmatimonadales bacterium]
MPFRLLGLLIVAALVYVGWMERARLAPYWHRLTDRPAATAVGTTGRPGVLALRRATDKVDSLNGWGADSVTLSASEMASLVGAGLDQRVRSELDSLAVTLGEGRIAVAGKIRTAGLPRDVLGPLAGAFNDREPIQGAGPVQVTGPGLAAWRLDAFQVRDFEFPREMVPRIVGLLAGDQRDSVLSIVIPVGIGRVRVHPDGVTLYPSSQLP